MFEIKEKNSIFRR